MRNRTRLIVRYLTGAAVAFAALSAVGCGEATGEVTGTVKYNGHRLDGGQVQFQSGSGKLVVAEIDKDGKYTATGVPAGTAKIAVSYVDPKVADFYGAASAHGRGHAEGTKAPPMPKGDPNQFSKIPTKYADLNGSGLTFEVKKGSNIHPIDLK